MCVGEGELRTWVQALEDAQGVRSQEVVNHPVWVLGTELRSSRRAVSTFNPFSTV